MYRGIAVAARMPRITITTMSSMNVKPVCLFLIFFSFPGGFAPPLKNHHLRRFPDNPDPASPALNPFTTACPLLSQNHANAVDRWSYGACNSRPQNHVYGRTGINVATVTACPPVPFGLYFRTTRNRRSRAAPPVLRCRVFWGAYTSSCVGVA